MSDLIERLRQSLRDAVNTRDWEIAGLQQELAEARGLLAEARKGWMEPGLRARIDAFLAATKEGER